MLIGLVKIVPIKIVPHVTIQLLLFVQGVLVLIIWMGPVIAVNVMIHVLIVQEEILETNVTHVGPRALIIYLQIPVIVLINIIGLILHGCAALV